jgi:trk system potassium uptake protein TrkA
VFVVVVGCGRVGSALARELADEGHDVSVVDESAEAFERLGDGFPGTFVEGPALEVSVLEAAGIERADAFVAATNGDNTNIVIAQVAQDRYHVPCVVVRVLDPYRAKFYEARGLTTICPTATAISLIGAAVRGYAERAGSSDGSDG